MHLYRTAAGPVVSHQSLSFLIQDETWDQLFRHENLLQHLGQVLRTGSATQISQLPPILAPAESQEVWAAGVTYMRSREARMEESKSGGDFYDRVYSADRPELFFKSPGYRVVGHGEDVRIRRDAQWSVPEPELVLAISPAGKVFGYSIGNDMSSRDIEGENPLYLPQAKTYDGSCALGPCLLITDEKFESSIDIEITRDGSAVFSGGTSTSQIKRSFDELAGYLCRELSFPAGALLMTGTGIVPPDEFRLQRGDSISITIASIGTLKNQVA